MQIPQVKRLWLDAGAAGLLGIVLLLVIGVDRLMPKADQPKEQASSDIPKIRDHRPPANEHKAGTERDKLLAMIKEKLDTFKPTDGKKVDEDLFVVGTIDLQNHHATVDFVIKEGVQQAADFIADFASGKAPGVIRDWRVFGRERTMKATEVLRAKAKSQSIEERLAAFNLKTPGKNSPDDYFVVGIADVNSTTLHADIRFEIFGGVKSAADFIIDFSFNRPKDHKGDWNVFFRASTKAEAIGYRQQMRDWYDSLPSQRAEIAGIYQAKTTKRC